MTTTLKVQFSTADLDEVEVYVGDTYFWVGHEVNSARVELANGRDQDTTVEAACARLGIDSADVREAAYHVGCTPYSATCDIDSDHTAEHLADLFGCDPEDVSN